MLWNGQTCRTILDSDQASKSDQLYSEAMAWNTNNRQCLCLRAILIRIYREALGLLCLLAMAALTASCASSPYDEPEQVNPGFSTISIVSTEDLIKAVTSDTESERSREGALAGGAAGAVGGALIGAAACSPTVYLAPLCATVYGIYGAFYGGVVAGAAGSIFWGSTGLSDEDAMYLKEEALRVDHDRDLNNELALSLQQKLPGEMLRPAAEADVQAIPIIENISFVKADKDLVKIKVFGSLIFAAGEGDEVTRHGQIEFDARTESREIDAWLDNSGSAIGEAMDECLDRIAGKMARLILEKRSSTGTLPEKKT